MNSFRAALRRLGAAASCVALAAVAGCATRADLIEVQKDQRAVRALLADQQVAIDGLRRRVEMLRSEASEPGKGRRGAAAPDVERALSDLESRLTAVEQARGAAPPSTGTPPPPLELERPPAEVPPAEVPPPAEARPTPTAPRVQGPLEAALAKEEAAAQGARVDSDYREGLQLIRRDQCSQAVPKLRDFIRKNPKSDFADNAQYWIGTCYYGQRDYNRAIIELNEVLLKYPKGDKVPAALLLLANAFADSGDKIDARLILQKLISDHPRSEEAERGRQKLPSLGE